jgi:tRNA threonylcarbamoyladenosine biosynthesis protein TsaB
MNPPGFAPGGAILAFDCAGAVCSAALWRAGQVLARRQSAQRHGQAEILLPMIEAALSEAGLGYDGLAAIATTIGPGSFTGLRAGLAAARGIALATGLPAAGIGAFDAAAHATASGERRGRSVLAAIDSRRAEIFVQVFDAGLTPLGAPLVLTPEEAASSPVLPAGALLLAGDAAPALLAALQARARDTVLAKRAGATDVAVVAALAEARLAAGDALPLRPLYLRPPDVTPQPKRGGLGSGR